MNKKTIFPLLMIPLCISKASVLQDNCCEEALKNVNLNYEAVQIDSTKEESFFNNYEPYYNNYPPIENQQQQPSSPDFLIKGEGYQNFLSQNEIENELSVIQQFQNLQYQEKDETNQKSFDGEQQSSSQYDQIYIQDIV